MKTQEEEIIEYMELEIKRNPFRFHNDMNLTELEEELMNELEIEDEVWEENDYSFFMYSWLCEEGILDD